MHDKEKRKLLLSVKEACEITGLSEKTLRLFIYDNNMQVRIGRRVFVHRKKLEEWIDSQINRS